MLQIELATPYYYSTLGFDEELLDYINFIDDSFMYDILPKYSNHRLGRKPSNPVVLWRMHYLFFIKPEFVKFRQMCNELKKPKHQDYRNFIGVHDIKDVPSHAALSRFRKLIGITEEQAKEIRNGLKPISSIESKIDLINKEMLKQAQKFEGFLDMTVGSIDSRPVKAKVGGFTKSKKDNDSEETYSDADAKVGRQRLKVNQNKYFIGYRKNTLIVRSSQGPAPLTSVVVNAKTSDQKVTVPIVEQAKKVGAKPPYIIADMGYMDDDTKINLAEDFSVIVHTEVKSSMVPPEYCDEKGRLECPECNIMNVLDYDNKKLEIIAGISDKEICQKCLQSNTCDGEFILSMKDNPHYYNLIPQKSIVQKELLKFRKQSELNFAIESNTLDNKLVHDKLPIKKIAQVDVFTRLADMFRLIKMIIHHCREKFLGDDYIKILRNMASEVVYNRKQYFNFKEVC
jgi:hypothetical protein